MRVSVRPVVVILVLVVALASIHGPRANTRANRLATGGAEAAIQGETTIVHFRYDDPNDNPDNGIQDVILVAWNDFNHRQDHGVSVGYGRSLAGGMFVHVPAAPASALVVPDPQNTAPAGDPVLAVDHHAGLDDGVNPVVYLAQLLDAGNVAIYVFESIDGGRTFPANRAKRVSGDLGGDPTIRKEDDKPWIAVDQRGGNDRPPDGNGYVCWTRMESVLNVQTKKRSLKSRIWFSQRSPTANQFEDPVAISDVKTAPQWAQGCQVAVDAAGNVYVAWLEFLSKTNNLPVIMVRRAAAPTDDDALAFGDQVQAVVMRRAAPGRVECGGTDNLWSAAGRKPHAVNLPSLALDALNGDIYLAYSQWRGPKADDGPTRFDVFFKSAPSPGAADDWKSRKQVRVNDDDGNKARDQWYPAITAYPLPVQPTPNGVDDSTLKIQWYDKRNSTDNDTFEIWSATSGNGAAWTNTKVSAGNLQSLEAGGIDCRPGDYHSITSATLSVAGPDGNGAVDAGNFLHSWSDLRAGAATDPEVYYFTQEISTTEGGDPVPPPPEFSDAKLVSLTAPVSVPGDVGISVSVLVTGTIENQGPEDAVMNAWYSVIDGPSVDASWGAASLDACYGSPTETQEGPLIPTAEVDCPSAARVTALGIEEELANGGQLAHDRSLSIVCLEQGVHSVTIDAGVAPVLPLTGSGDVVDDNLSDNGLSSTLNVVCSCAFPVDVTNLVAEPDKQTNHWNGVPAAIEYDAVRGTLGDLPVGSVGGDEVCFASLEDPSLVDATVPAPGSGFYYVVRAVNPCGAGGYGYEGAGGAPGAPRSSAVCP